MENYKLFLYYLNKKLDSHFEEQKPYIFCKKGCAKCCQNAEFPYSKLEATYLKLGFVKLDNETRELVTKNIAKIKKEKMEFKGDKFLYTCPFLIDNVCSVYDYRGVVCRTFGLISVRDDTTANLPFCHNLGLNYSNVVDHETNKITSEKWLQTGIETEPHGFKDISYDYLTGKDFEEKFDIKFEEKRPLIEWL